MPLVLSRGVSKIGGLYTDTFLSKAHIRSFIRKNKIDMQDYEDRKFRSLNDFFTRKVKEGKRPLLRVFPGGACNAQPRWMLARGILGSGWTFT